MKLEEQFYKVCFNECGLDVNGCVEIVENFAIGFSEWLMVKCDYKPHCVWGYQGDEYTQKELLEIYKKTL